MKKAFETMAISLILALTGCGASKSAADYAPSDKAMLSVAVDDKARTEAVLTVDGHSYPVTTIYIKYGDGKSPKGQKFTDRNTVYVSPGIHDVKIVFSGATVYNQKVLLSAGERKYLQIR